MLAELKGFTELLAVVVFIFLLELAWKKMMKKVKGDEK